MSWISLEDVLKTSWQDVLKTSWRCLEDVFAIRLEDVLKTSWQDSLKTSWKRLENVLKTSWRRMTKTIMLVLIKVFWKRLLKTYELGEYIRLDQDVLKKSPEDEKRLQDVFIKFAGYHHCFFSLMKAFQSIRD